MVEVGKLKIGDRVLWLGSSKSLSYGNRRVPAEIVKIKPERIQIKIKTPYGEILKYVSANALALETQK